MAGSDPLNNEGFSIPTLKQYQDLLRQQAVDSVGKDAPGYSKLMQAGIFDAMRATGKLSRNEQLVGQANTIQQQANDEVAQSGETDPAKMRLMALTSMIRRFNAMGMSDLSAKAMPELVALQQRAQEMRKLKAEATSEESKARVDVATEAEDTLAPGYKNDLTQAQTDEAIANKDFTKGAKTEESKASAANTSSEAMARNNEGVFYYKLDADGNPSQQVSVRQSNTKARETLRANGWIEAKQPGLVAATTSGLGMPKAETADLLKEMEQADETLDTYRTVAGQFRPEFLTMGGKAENYIAGVAEGAGMKLSPEQKGNLDAFQQFRAGSVSAMNAYIKKIAGTAVSKAEELRVYAAAPDPMHDSPTQFIAKMRDTARLVIGYRERARKYLAAGGQAGLAPHGDAWDGIGVPAVTDAQVDEFLGRNFNIPVPRRTGAPNTAPSRAPGVAPGAGTTDQDGYTIMPNGARVKKIS